MSYPERSTYAETQEMKSVSALERCQAAAERVENLLIESHERLRSIADHTFGPQPTPAVGADRAEQKPIGAVDVLTAQLERNIALVEALGDQVSRFKLL